MESTNSQSKRVILLVEDEAAHAALVRRLFEDDTAKWDFHHIERIASAMKWLDEHKDAMPSVVISDYRLPDGTGMDLARGAEIPEEVGFPLIILTGVGSEQLAVQTLKGGAMDYVVKSALDLQKLPQTARRVIREWASIVERRRAEEDLRNYIRDLEQANCDLEEFVDRITQDLETALSSITEFNDLLLEKYSDKLDENAHEYLYRSKNAAERANKLIDGLLEFLIPVYFDSSLIKLYSAKLRAIKRGGQEISD